MFAKFCNTQHSVSTVLGRIQQLFEPCTDWRHDDVCCLRKTSANHDGVWVGDVGKICQSQRNPIRKAIDYLESNVVTVAGRCNHRFTTFASCKKRQATARCVALPTATLTARTHGPLGINNHVADLSCETLCSSLQHATRHQTAANTSAECDHPHIASTYCCAMFPFAERTARCVIIYPDTIAHSILQLPKQRQLDCGWHVRARTNHAVARNQTRHANAKRFIVAQTLNKFDNRVCKRICVRS